MRSRILFIVILLSIMTALPCLALEGNSFRIQAKIKYPDNVYLQELEYYQQLSACFYMIGVPDKEIKHNAIVKYSSDYVQQKIFYDKQALSKAYMMEQSDSHTKALVESKYPDDYEKQQLLYDQLISAP